ncbi:flagellar hook-associated protein FlgL [Georgenia yuyongxinii]|uniref:Flagellar hook-associated protein 3 n=1 Tax=Georgenia yuyongxinii TaxID=2589797 RepID=A0A552WSB6_9MICO|nr:flagellar hook-associated protein FlgL [Georgenia yuyongxinii]TRW45614.1 flagellar hook-associated protein 3 [Georgenia yuyongxinii]
MINRVTQQGLQQQTLRNLQSNLSRISQLQQQLSSGKAITKASDDPAGMVDAMRIRGDQRANAQYTRNAADGVGWLSTVDSALQGSTALLTRARNLTVQGANAGALGPAAREALATEIEAISEALREQANSQYLGRSVFAGTSGANEAFGPRPDYEFTGQRTDGTPYPAVHRRVSDNTLVQVDSNGKAVFGTEPWRTVSNPPDPDRPATPTEVDATASAGTSVFALLKQVATDLRDGKEVSGYLTHIDIRMSAMLKEISASGTRYNQVLQAQDLLASDKVTLKGQLSDVEDVDLAETIVAIKTQEVAYQSALSATSRALQPSLLDFLR